MQAEGEYFSQSQEEREARNLRRIERLRQLQERGFNWAARIGYRDYFMLSELNRLMLGVVIREVVAAAEELGIENEHLWMADRLLRWQEGHMSPDSLRRLCSSDILDLIIPQAFEDLWQMEEEYQQRWREELKNWEEPEEASHELTEKEMETIREMGEEQMRKKIEVDILLKKGCSEGEYPPPGVWFH